MKNYRKLSCCCYNDIYTKNSEYWPNIQKVINSMEKVYSEWLEGPQLIAQQWNNLSSLVQRPSPRAYHWHTHKRGHLFCVETGLIQVLTHDGTWILPPYRAAWIPPDTEHAIQICSANNGWSLYFTPDICLDLPQTPCVIGINELIKALIMRAISWDKMNDLPPEEINILRVIVDEIKRSPHESLHLPIPQDNRLKLITNAILNEPDSMRPIEQWAAIGSISARTMRRLIQIETGMSFGQWRQQAQLIHALEMLAQGMSVMDTAYALGYSTPSSFIAMFKRAFGDSPAHYFARKTNDQ